MEAVTVFVDTSAIYAVMDRSDGNHVAAARTWKTLLEGDVPLRTSNYVLVESAALVQHRLGMDAVRVLMDDIVPVIKVRFVSPEQHRTALAALLAAGRRRLSLVDCVSFTIMREEGIRKAFAFDTHFTEQGFQAVTSG